MSRLTLAVKMPLIIFYEAFRHINDSFNQSLKIKPQPSKNCSYANNATLII